MQIRQVHQYLARRSPRTRLVIGGWGGGPQLPPVLRGLDRALPQDVIFSCLNPGMGAKGHAPVLAEVAQHRPTWSIPWFEGDGWLWHLQFRATSVSDQVKAAYADKLPAWSASTGAPRRFARIWKPLLSPSAIRAGTARCDLYRRHCARVTDTATVETLAPLLLQFEKENQLGYLSSPEFYPYDPKWGRLPAGLAEKLRAAIESVSRLKERTPEAAHRES